MGLFTSKRNPAPPKEAAPEPEKKPEATPLTREDVQALVTGAMTETTKQLTGVISELRTGIESISRQPVVVQQATQQHYEQPITDEDIDNAVASGQGAAKIVRGLLDRQARDVRAGLEQRIGELENFGARAIGGLNVERLQTREHYARFKKEIDAKVGALPDAYKANPDTLDLIYNSVIGGHAKELENEAREAALRQAADGTASVKEIDVRAGGSKPGASGANRSDRPTVPDAESFAGKEGLAALQHKERGGKDPDTFAQSMGYKNWDHYIAQYQQLQAEQGDA